MKRDFITLEDFESQEIIDILNLAIELKNNPHQATKHLDGKSIGLIFQKPSNRTRVSFEVGVWQLGGNCVYLGPKEIALGKRESSADVAKTLSRYLDGIVARTHSHDDVIALGSHATVPVINGLSDLYHPCQAMADIMSIKERFGKVQGLTVAYIGDGNNVCHSLLLGCAKVGINVNVAAPDGYFPNSDIVKKAQMEAKKNGATITLTQLPKEAAKDAHVIYADVWVSMGQEEESSERLKLFQDYQINAELTREAHPDHIFMHCLPAHRGEEVTAEIIDGPHSIIFDQAENRMHAQKAILIFLLSQK